MRLLRDKGRNILARLTFLIKGCILDVVEGNLTRQEWVVLYSCVVIIFVLFISRVVL